MKSNIVKYLIIILMICIIAMYGNNFSIIIFGGIFYTFGLLYCKDSETEKKIFNTSFLFNLVVILIIAIIYTNKFGMPYYNGGSDDLNYENDASTIIRFLSIFDYHGMKSVLNTQFYDSIGYVYFLSLLMRIANVLGGYSTYIPRIFNALLVAIMCILLYRISVKNFKLSNKKSYLIAVYLSIVPINSYVSSHVFRDTIIEFCFVFLYYTWVTKRIGKLTFIYNILATIGIYIIISQLRPPLIYVYILFIVVLFMSFISKRLKKTLDKKRRSLFRYFQIVIILVSIMGILIGSPYVYNRYLYYSDYYTNYTLNAGNGLSNYIFNMPPPYSIIFRVMFLLVSPFPAFDNSINIFLTIGTGMQYLLIPFLVYGIILTFKDEDKFVLTFFFCITFIVIASTTFTFRHIVTFYPFMILLSFNGLFALYEKNKSRVKSIVASMIFIGTFLFVLYLVIKF